MNEKKLCSDLRSEFGKLGLALIIYYAIMNVTVVLAAVIDGIYVALTAQVVDVDAILDRLISNGWGYIAACLIGAGIMLIWKKKQFCFHDIWQPNRPMTPGSFFMILCIFISAQAVFEMFASCLEWLFNLVGMSVMESVEVASGVSDTLSMFLYMGLFAPVFEEILFRGLILRSLQPYGKKFAILGSAFLFGIFHGNIVQTPFAFAVGLVLGYVAVEYSMSWAMVLHMINNLLLSDSLTRIAQLLPDWMGELIYFVIIWGCAVAAVVILIVKRKKVTDYFRNRKIHPLCLKSFFTSPGILVLTAIMVGNILLTLLMQLLV